MKESNYEGKTGVAGAVIVNVVGGPNIRTLFYLPQKFSSTGENNSHLQRKAWEK